MSTLASLFILATALVHGLDEPAPSDDSLTVDQYIEKGLPAPRRYWGAREYERALDVLTKIKADRKTALPRKDSKRSAAVFQRLVNVQNLEATRTSNLPVGAQLGETLGILRHSGQIFLLYLNLNPGGKPQEYGPECLELSAFTLSVFDALFRVSDTFISGLDAKAKADPARRKGLDQMRNGLATSLSGVMVILDEREQYSAADLDAFATRLPRLVPPLWPWLDETVRKELLLQIDEKVKSHPSPPVRDALKALRGKVESIKGPPKDPFTAAPTGARPRLAQNGT